MAKRKETRKVAPKPGRRFPEWAPAALALAGLAILFYASSLANGFVADDDWQLLKNPVVTDAAKIPQMFGSGVWSFIGAHGNYYRPMQFLVYLLLYKCAGFHPAVFHLLMVLLHAGNTVLLFLLVRRFARGRVALAAAALFAAHPVHTEVVDWIAALPDLMLTTLTLTGVLWFARQEGAPRGIQILGHCGLFLAALLTKETGVTLLPLYAGFGFFILGHGWSELRRNAGLFAAMMASFGVYLLMRGAALGGLAPAQGAFIHLTHLEFALSVVVMAAHYLGMLIVPAGLNYFHVFYPTRGVTPEFLISALALAALAVSFFRFRIALLSYGIFWIVSTLALCLNLTGVGENVFAERYLYLPSAGFCWIAGWAWDWLAGRQPQWAKLAAAAVLLACAFQVLGRNGDWRDDVTLLELTARQSPTSALVQDALASAYVERNAFDKALACERLAVSYQPERAVYRKKLGYILLAKDPRAAVPEFQKAVGLQPAAPDSHFDLGLAFEATGNAKQALDEYRKTLQLAPRYPEARERYERVQANLR